MTLPVAILAGGLATRLRPITETVPKSLVAVAGRPFIFHQLEWLRKQGVHAVVLCVAYRGEQIREVVRDGQRFGLSVRYSFDGDKLLGTGGAIKKAVSLLGDSFSILYGDSYLQCAISEVERAFQLAAKPALMTVLKNDGKWDTSNVLFRAGRVVRYDKHSPSPEMRHIDYGLSVVRAEIFKDYPDGEKLDLASVFTALSEKGELTGYEVTSRFYEIGTQRGVMETERFLMEKESECITRKSI